MSCHFVCIGKAFASEPALHTLSTNDACVARELLERCQITVVIVVVR